MKTLNLGCGVNKIEGSINVDTNPDVKPDMCFDFRNAFPLADNEFDEIYLFHTIEHIEKRYHPNIFAEIRRVLKEDGKLIVTFPEFTKIVANWLINKSNDRNFWEATIYGLQRYPSDYHVCIMDSLELKQFLFDRGFTVIKSIPEPAQDYNTVMYLEKGPMSISYEELVFNEVFVK